MHACAEARPIHHRLEPIGNHLEGLFPRSTLGHPIEQRNLSQPESSITNQFPFKPHVCSFETRLRIASASFSLISRCLGTASSRSPSVQTSWRPPCRRNRQPKSISRFSSSRRFISFWSVHYTVYSYYRESISLLRATACLSGACQAYR